MAQWIPKTAWKLQNLNKAYGVGEIGLHVGDQILPKGIAIRSEGGQRQAPFLAAPFRPVPAVFSSSQEKTDDARSNGRSMLKKAYDAQVPFIDLRDAFEAEAKPLKKAIQLHHHDILSGAANDILPQDRRNAQIVVFASTQQRVLNGYKALRRWGFESVVVTNYDVVAEFDSEK